MRLFLLKMIILLFILTSCNKESYNLTEANKLVHEIQKNSNTPGIAITVSINNNIVWSKGYGLANIEQETRVDPSKTKFRIGSISKSLTSAALGVLISEEKINVDLPVQIYVPYFPQKKWPITTRLVAGHLAGIRHYSGNEFMSKEPFHTIRAGVEIFSNDPLLHQPNTKYKYSSYGFNLLSAIIEGASGTDFLDYMDEMVFDPLQMNNTLADLKDSLIQFRSGFYEFDSERLINAPYVDNSYKWAGGGFLSTSEDIVSFGNALLNNNLFPKAILDTLIKSQVTVLGDTTAYGMGFKSGVTKSGKHYFGHTGGSVGGSCNLMIFPSEKLVIAVLTNTGSSPMGKKLDEVAELFMKQIK